jgi:hypothetical protein
MRNDGRRMPTQGETTRKKNVGNTKTRLGASWNAALEATNSRRPRLATVWMEEEEDKWEEEEKKLAALEL